jgi:hypothetical protein
VVSSTTTTTPSTSNTLQAGQSTSVTINGVTTAYVSNGLQAQTLSSVSGVFSAGANLVESLPSGQPPQTIPPAPPGIILKVNDIQGAAKSPINLFTDPDIFGYDPLTGQLVRFNLNLETDTGTEDLSFTPITVPGHQSVAGLNLAWEGNQLVVLVSAGTHVYAYSATTGKPAGSFTTTVPINSIGSSGTTVVLGSYSPSELFAINLPASLAHQSAQIIGGPMPLTLPGGVTLLGGLTGVPASTTIYATVAATFDSFQPTQQQLGIASISTAGLMTTPGKGTKLTTSLASGSQSAIQQMGMPIVVPSIVQPVTTLPGPALGSVDQDLAVVLSASGGTNTVNLYPVGSSTSKVSLTLNYADPLVALSSTFRPDLKSTALIDIQGNVQSVRGGSATGMVLNDSGNLNLVKFTSLTNSTIVGQPLSHLEIAHRSNNVILTTKRQAAGRNGVTVERKLPQFGPLSQTND